MAAPADIDIKITNSEEELYEALANDDQIIRNFSDAWCSGITCGLLCQHKRGDCDDDAPEVFTGLQTLMYCRDCTNIVPCNAKRSGRQICKVCDYSDHERFCRSCLSVRQYIQYDWDTNTCIFGCPRCLYCTTCADITIHERHPADRTRKKCDRCREYTTVGPSSVIFSRR